MATAAHFGELILILGDMHDPYRTISIPEKFRKMLVQYMLFLMYLCPSSTDRYQTKCSTYYVPEI